MTYAPTNVQQTNFDTIAAIYDSVFPEHITEHFLQQRLAYIAKHAVGKRALDVGAGTGVLAERLVDRGLEVVALDPFPNMLNQLRQRRPAIATVVAAGHEMPFPDGAFDFTYSVAVMHHIADPEMVRRTLREMVRVTRPNGRILIWDHNPSNLYWPIIMKKVPQDTGDERLLPMEEIVDSLRASGATILHADRRGFLPEFVPERLMPMARRIEQMVETTPVLRRYCSHNVILASRNP